MYDAGPKGEITQGISSIGPLVHIKRKQIGPLEHNKWVHNNDRAPNDYAKNA